MVIRLTLTPDYTLEGVIECKDACLTATATPRGLNSNAAGGDPATGGQPLPP